MFELVDEAAVPGYSTKYLNYLVQTFYFMLEVQKCVFLSGYMSFFLLISFTLYNKKFYCIKVFPG